MALKISGKIGCRRDELLEIITGKKLLGKFEV